MIFSAANLASGSDAKSSGVTMLDIDLPWMKALGRRIGVIAARQYPGRRSYVTIENFDSAAISQCAFRGNR
jgi:hypothetical protein